MILSLSPRCSQWQFRLIFSNVRLKIRLYKGVNWFKCVYLKLRALLYAENTDRSPRQNVTNVPLLSFSAPRYSVYDTGLFESSVNGIWNLYSPLLSFLYRHETSPELGSSQTASVFLTNAKQPPKEKKIEKRKKKWPEYSLGERGLEV